MDHKTAQDYALPFVFAREHIVPKLPLDHKRTMKSVINQLFCCFCRIRHEVKIHIFCLNEYPTFMQCYDCSRNENIMLLSRNFCQLTTNVALSEESGMSSKFIEEEKSERLD